MKSYFINTDNKVGINKGFQAISSGSLVPKQDDPIVPPAPTDPSSVTYNFLLSDYNIDIWPPAGTATGGFGHWTVNEGVVCNWSSSCFIGFTWTLPASITRVWRVTFYLSGTLTIGSDFSADVNGTPIGGSFETIAPGLYKYTVSLSDISVDSLNLYVAGSYDYRLTSVVFDRNSSWCYTFDFTKSNGGFEQWLGQGSDYVAGQGWRDITRSNNTKGLEIIRYFDASILTEISATIVSTNVTSANVYIGTDPGGWYVIDTQNNGTNTYVHSELSLSGITSVLFNAAATSADLIICTSVTFKGLRVNPFGNSNC